MKCRVHIHYPNQSRYLSWVERCFIGENRDQVANHVRSRTPEQWKEIATRPCEREMKFFYSYVDRLGLDRSTIYDGSCELHNFLYQGQNFYQPVSREQFVVARIINL